MNNFLLLTNSEGAFDPRSLGNLSYWLDASDLSTITQDTNGFSTLNNKSLQALNSPLEISGCQLWMDGADSSTVFQNSNGTTPSTNNTNVGYWADKSGNNRNFTQSSSGLAPTYITNVQNGLSVIRFSSSKEMTIASSTSAFNFLHNSTGTVYIVVKLNSTFELNDFIYLLSNSANSSANIGFNLFIDDRTSFTRNNLILSSVWYGSSGNSVSSRAIDGAVPSLSDYCIIRVSLNNNAQSNYRNIVAVDGVTQRQTLNTASNNPSNSNASLDLKLGPPNSNTFEVAEIIVYSNQHTLEESTRVEKYLGSKWNIKSNDDSVESPLEIGGCSIWLDGADISTFKQNSNGTVDVTSNNDRVGYWADKSGNNRHATQATGGIRPYFKSNSRNNKSGVYFDGTNYLDISYQTPGPDGEIFVVAQFPSDWQNPATGRRQILESRVASTGGFEIGVFTTGNSLLFIYDGAQRQATHTTGYRANGHHIIASFFNSNSHGMALDGDSYSILTGFTMGSANTTLRVGSVNISGHQPWISDICEIIYFNKRLTSKNRKRIERYLSKKWNIDLSEEPAVNFGGGRSNSSSVSDDYTVSSIQSPNEISTCALWLDASDASSLKQANNGTGDVSVNGTNVRYWQDKSGNNRNATQAVLASSPTYNINAVNGRSALLFATDRFLDISSFDITPSTIFLVYKQTTGNANAQTPLCLQESTGGNFANFVCQSTGTVRVGYSANGANNYYNTNSTAISGDTMIVSAMQVDSGTILNTHLNGIPLAESNVVQAPDGNVSKIGCRFRTSTNDQFFSGYLCEIIVYQSVLNNNQRRSVEKYLAEKWGVNITTHYFPVSFWKNKVGDDGMMRVPGQTDGTRPIFNINTANRRSTVYFNQLNFLRSSLIAADWKYLSDGAVYTIFFVGKIGNTLRPNTIHTVLRTYGSANTATGMLFWLDARSTTNSGDGTWQFRVANGIGVNNGFRADCSLVGTPCNNWYVVSGIMNHNSALSTATNSLIAGTGYKSLMKVNDSVWITNSGHGGSAVLNPVNPEGNLNMGTLGDGATSFNLLGEVGEILIYKSILTPSQVQLVQNYLSDKWNVPLSTRTNLISSPKEISDCILWLDANDSSTLKQNLDQTGDIEDGYPVCWWLDKSDNANHVFQKGPLLRPTYNTNRIGSKPAVYFDGNDWLFSTTNKSSVSACTIFVVLRNYLSTSSISGLIQYTAGHSAGNVGPGIYANAVSQYVCDGNGASTTTSANTPYPRSGSSSWSFRNFTKLITAVYPTGAVNTLNSKIYIDGGLEEIHTNSSSVATISSNSRVQIGGRTTGDQITRVFVGDIAEIIVYNRELSDSDRVRVEKYLSSKWGIT